MEKAHRKELVREYRERQQMLGVYAVRCEPAGLTWVAATRNLDRQQNGIWFQLRGNGHPNSAMTSAWRRHGEGAFKYEILEQVTDENPLLIDLLLKERTAHWLNELKAEPVIG
jgi:hypothetical protein